MLLPKNERTDAGCISHSTNQYSPLILPFNTTPNDSVPIGITPDHGHKATSHISNQAENVQLAPPPPG